MYCFSFGMEFMKSTDGSRVHCSAAEFEEESRRIGEAAVASFDMGALVDDEE